MECNIKNVIKITQGSKEDILIRLSDPSTGERFDLTPFDTFKACFKNSAGVILEKTITPPTDPKLGVVEFILDSVDTLTFDKDMRNFELIFGYTADSNEHIVLLNDSLEVTERACI